MQVTARFGAYLGKGAYARKRAGKRRTKAVRIESNE